MQFILEKENFDLKNLSTGKIIGSIVRNMQKNNSVDTSKDIDIFTNNEQDYIYLSTIKNSDTSISLHEKLLSSSSLYEKNLSPYILYTDIYDKLENIQTFKNCCYCINTKDNKILYGDNYINDKNLLFNPYSLILFNNYKQIEKLLYTLLQEGYTINTSEKNYIYGYKRICDFLKYLYDIKIYIPDKQKYISFLSLLKDNNAYITGGCFRDTYLGYKFKDIDIIFTSLDNMINVMNILTSYNNCIITFNNCINNILIMKTIINNISYDFLYYTKYNNIKDIIEIFDFTINQIYYDIKNKSLLSATDYTIYDIFNHIQNKQLILSNNCEKHKNNKLRMLQRYIKFAKKGYKMTTEDTKKYKNLLFKL